MTNPRVHEIDNHRVRVRCPECRTTFHERLHRVMHSRLVCPHCRNEMRFRGIGHIHEHDTVENYIRHVEQLTSHPHFLLRD
jgi:transposase-like protein